MSATPHPALFLGGNQRLLIFPERVCAHKHTRSACSLSLSLLWMVALCSHVLHLSLTHLGDTEIF